MHHPTRRRAAGGILLCALATLAACADQSADMLATPVLEADQELVERVVSMGFRRDMIVDRGDHFQVEGDIVVRKADLAGPLFSEAIATGSGPSFQYHTTNLVSQSKMAGGIRISLAGISTSTVWLNAARAAISYWNATGGTKIYMVEGTPADISVAFGTLGPGVAGSASWPSGGNPGPTITISTAIPMDQGQKQWVMVHELGHTLGYRHTNWQATGESAGTIGAVHITGTPTGADNSSVMRSGLSSWPYWSSFSTYDQVANRYLYPGPAPTFTSQGFDGANHPQFAWSSVSNASHYAVTEWVYYWEFILYDPQVSSTNGYWGWQAYYGGETSAYGTSHTDSNATANSSGSCYTEYWVSPVYPSSKRGYGQSVTFDAC
jgi:hypothetical protein